MKFLKIALLLILISCTATIETAEKEVIMTTENEETTDTGNQKAYFAGGCFWCMEPPFEALEEFSVQLLDIWVAQWKILLMKTL